MEVGARNRKERRRPAVRGVRNATDIADEADLLKDKKEEAVVEVLRNNGDWPRLWPG